MENLMNSEMEKYLSNYPRHYRETINVRELVKKVLDPLFAEIICTLYRTQRDMEDLISMKREDLILSHARKIKDIAKTGKKNLVKVMLLQQAEIASNNIEIHLEVDRMVSFQHEIMVNMEIPGFYKTDSEEDELLQQKHINKIYELVLMARKIKNDQLSLQ